MYTDLLVDATNYTFQLKDETGADIGSAEVFPIANHTMDPFFVPGMICVFDQDVTEKVWPPVAAFPIQRLIVHH